jgi:hypothetical protein
MNMVMQNNETIIKEGKANSFNVLISKGGHLAITNQRVLWQGHGFNIGGQADVIKLEDIVAYGKCCTMVLGTLFLPIPNAIYISTNMGQTYKYTVYGRKVWLETLAKAIRDTKKDS